MMALGDAYMEGNGVRRDLDAAIGWFTPVAQTNDANALYQLSYALRERNNPGDLDLALRFGLAASERARKAAPPFQAAIQIQLGYVFDAMKRFDEAVAAYEAARRLVERQANRNPLQIVAIYLNLANALAGAGRQEESAIASDRAIAVLATLPEASSDLMADLYTNKAISLISIASYGEALTSLDAALAIYAKHAGPDSLNAANVLKTKSRTYSLLARYQEAIDAAQAALAIYDKAQAADPKAIAQSRVMLGLAYQGQAHFDKAREEYQAAANILESNGGKDSIEMIHPLTNLGNVDDELGRHDEALRYYEKALALMTDVLGFDHPDVATMLGRLGNTSYHGKRYDAALDYGLRALLIQTNANDADIDSQRYTFRMLARTLEAKGHRKAALLFAKLAVNTHQAVRARNSLLPDEFRAALGESFQPSYRLLSELLLSDGQFSEAQFVGGLLKQQEFNEFLRNDNPKAKDNAVAEPGTVRLSKAEEQLWKSLQDLMVPTLRIAAEIHALTTSRAKTGALTPADESRLHSLAVSRDGALNSFVASVLNIIDRSESDTLLRQEEVLAREDQYTQNIQTDLKAMGANVVHLQVMSLENSVHFFVTAAGVETKHRELEIKRSELANKVSAALFAIQTRSEDALSRLIELDRILVSPVRSDLEAAVVREGTSAPTLLLDLSGFLRYVPYAALYDGKRFLVEDYAIALYNPAIRTKFTPMPRTKIKGAGFGVTREHPGFSALPGVGRELEAVFEILKGDFRLDNDFNESSLAKALARRPQILHIASHFRFRPGNETNSYLLLGNGDGLTLDQLRKQKRFRFRGVELITLSACETARGGGAEGEEIESFGALAQTNGASAVMSTLWQIPDNSTTQLMTEFYDNLMSRHLDKAHALREAQLAMIRGGEPQTVALQTNRSMTVVEDSGNAPQNLPPTFHPYYWAAFILMGNWM